ncbi:MAG: ParA family protein [Clostridia bacterium]|nr:ParA family protein [Clostridia bacterium]MBR5976635.1 ParA family protein [Clostridia bacterium]MBR5991368.1 ParA family protein [Clostridia bacterium]MBR6479037.1 ParA family protein [Clostridia bacterium]MBR6512192.1 ParA family protein [Clostridia bacterium]
MAKTVAILSQKGGVGKTTTAVNLIASIGAHGKRVLLCDSDAQGNSTSGFGIDKRSLKYSTYDIIMNNVPARDVIITTKFQGVDVLPSNMNLAAADLELVNIKGRESKLKNALLPLYNNYDYIFIDCPPSLGLITLNALCAADTIIIPIQCEFYALEGLSQLMATVRQVKRLYNPMLDLEGVVLTMYDGRLNLTQQVVAEVKKFFPKKVYASVIPRNVRLSEAPSFGMPVMYYDKNSRGSQAYEALAVEFLKQNKTR